MKACTGVMEEMKFTNKELNYEHIRCFFSLHASRCDAAGLLVLPGNRAHVSAQPLWPRLPQFCPTSDPASACGAAFGFFFFWFSVPRLLRVVPAVLLCSARQSPVHERPFSLLPPDLHAPSPPPPSLPSAKGSVLPPPLLRPPLPPHLRRSPLAQAPALTPTGSAACPRPYCLASLTPLLFAALLLWISSAATATCVLLYNAARVEQWRRPRASRCSLGRLGSEPGPAGAGTRCSAAAARSGRGQGPCGSEARGRAGSRGQARRLALLPRDIQGLACVRGSRSRSQVAERRRNRLGIKRQNKTKLEEENREFFKAYYMRLMLKSQIMVFNRLFEDQYRLMRKEHPAGVPSMPSTAPNVCNSGTLQAGELLRCCHSINRKKIRTPHLTMEKTETTNLNRTERSHLLPFLGKVKEEELRDVEIEEFVKDRYANRVRYAAYGGSTKECDGDFTMDGVLKEPTIWRVKCMAGCERQMAFCLCKTFVDFQEFGTNLAIISAFALDHACRGFCNVYASRISSAPASEVPSLLSSRANYKGDLAQVVSVDDGWKTVMIKLISTVDLQAISKKIVVSVDDGWKTVMIKLISIVDLQAISKKIKEKKHGPSEDISTSELTKKTRWEAGSSN